MKIRLFSMGESVQYKKGTSIVENRVCGERRKSAV